MDFVNAKRRKKTLKVTVKHNNPRCQSKNYNCERKFHIFSVGWGVSSNSGATKRNRVLRPHEGRRNLMHADDVNAKRRKKTLKVAVKHNNRRCQSTNSHFERRFHVFSV
ncbi:hypothetical protein CDAR_441191 [Caerostris darwini]|uniref:Uncharacterized protein n=1 Tax=Caerostris darwini TaxID=1538125 RepID=A0AAV4SHY3_9ARAC|nr:hypothetical protein CDAR_441191 [Caerostris darwini]